MTPATQRDWIAQSLGWTQPQLRQLLQDGHALAPQDLVGWQYQGIALGLPRWVERLSWKVFVKAFAQDGHGVHGWNVRIAQTGPQLLAPGADLVPMRCGSDPRTFGHYRVLPLRDWRRPIPLPCGPGVMLDYGTGDNPRLDPMRPMRDPLVALQPEDPTVLLGWSFAELGPLRLPTPSYFLLLRWRPVDFVPARVRPLTLPSDGDADP